MEGSKLLELLKTFNRPEMDRLDDFVQSPYHNKNRHVLGLWQYLAKQVGHSVYNTPKLRKEEIFKAVFLGKPYDDLKLRHIASMLLKLAEDFLVAERGCGSEERVKLMQAYRERKLGKHFEGARRVMVKGPLSIADHYQQYQAMLEEEQMDEQGQERRKTTRLQEVSDRLDVFYIISKLKQCCAMVSYQNVFKQEYRMHLAEEVLAHLEQHTYAEPLLNLYHRGLLILRNPADEDSFGKLKSLLIEHQHDIPLKEAQDLHVIARNYCIRKLNTGETRYLNELLDLFRFELQYGILLDDKGYLSPSTFKNIVAVGSRLGEFDWTEQFVKQYSATLEEKYHNDYLSYNLARVYFDRRDYPRSIQLLSQVEYHDIFVAADARTLLLKTYYELDEYDALGALLDSFKQFVTRRKELAYHKENYLNTIKFTRLLLSIGSRNKALKEKITKQVQDTKVLTERNWFLVKLGEK